jgi:hypothetical protein
LSLRLITQWKPWNSTSTKKLRPHLVKLLQKLNTVNKFLSQWGACLTKAEIKSIIDELEDVKLCLK